MKALSEILHGKRQDPILENSDEELEAALADEEPSSEGDVALVMARMSDIIDMADDLYNTVSELESVDGDTEAAAVSAYNALDDLYAAVKDRYEITTSEYDFDADGSDDLEESKTISEDWGSSDWNAAIVWMDEILLDRRLTPDSIEDAAREVAATYGEDMGYDMGSWDGEVDAINAIIRIWALRSETGKKAAAFFSPKKVNEDRTGRSYWIAKQNYVADLGQIKKGEIYLSTGQTEEEMIPTDNGLEAFDVINISIAAPGTSYAEALDPYVFKKIFMPLDPSKHKLAVNKLKRWDLVVPSATGEIVEAKDTFKVGDTVVIDNSHSNSQKRQYDVFQKEKLYGTVRGQSGDKVDVEYMSGDPNRGRQTKGSMSVKPADVTLAEAKGDTFKVGDKVWIYGNKKTPGTITDVKKPFIPSKPDTYEVSYDKEDRFTHLPAEDLTLREDTRLTEDQADIDGTSEKAQKWEKAQAWGSSVRPSIDEIKKNGKYLGKAFGEDYYKYFGYAWKISRVGTKDEGITQLASWRAFTFDNTNARYPKKGAMSRRLRDALGIDYERSEMSEESAELEESDARKRTKLIAAGREILKSLGIARSADKPWPPIGAKDGYITINRKKVTRDDNWDDMIAAGKAAIKKNPELYGFTKKSIKEESAELTEGKLTVQKLRKIFMNADDWGEDMHLRTYVEGGRLIFLDSYWAGGDKALDSLVKSWKPGGSYYDYFKKTYGAHIQVVNSFQEIKATGRHKKFTKDGVVGVELKVESGSDTPVDELEESVDKSSPIYKEYEELKKLPIKSLRNKLSQTHKIVDLKGYDKEGAISQILRDKHGDKKVDAAFGFSESTELTEGSTRDYVDNLLPNIFKKAGAQVKVSKKAGYTSYSTNGYTINNDGVGISVKKGEKEIKYFDKPKLDYKKAVSVALDESTELTEAKALTKSQVHAQNYLSSAEYNGIRKQGWFDADAWTWDDEHALYARKELKGKKLSTKEAYKKRFISNEEYVSVKNKMEFQTDDWSWDDAKQLWEQKPNQLQTVIDKLSDRLLGEPMRVTLHNAEASGSYKSSKWNTKIIKDAAELLLQGRLKITYSKGNETHAQKIKEFFAAVKAGKDWSPTPAKKLESFLKK